MFFNILFKKIYFSLYVLLFSIILANILWIHEGYLFYNNNKLKIVDQKCYNTN
jgi:hypothetical protein